MTRPGAVDLSDDELVELVRSGDAEAFDGLWDRHARSARRIARQLAPAADADAIVEEARTAIQSRIRAGGGPSAGFRPYLYGTIRGLAGSGLTASADAGAALDRTLTARAYRSLPERWQTALWYSEVEGLGSGDIAPLLGLTPRAVEELVFRAREGLRTAWLQEHASDATLATDCRWAIPRLGGDLGASLSDADRRRRDAHVDGCARCTVLSEELEGVGSRLALAIAPVVIGGAAVGSIVAGTATAGVAAAAAGATAGASAALPAIAAPALVGTLAAVALVGGSVVLVSPPAVAPDPRPTGISSTTVADRTPARPASSPPAAPPSSDVPIADPVSTSLPSPPPQASAADAPAAVVVSTTSGSGSSGSGSSGSGSSGSGSSGSGSSGSGSSGPGSGRPGSGANGSGSHGSGSGTSGSGSSGSGSGHGSGSSGSGSGHGSGHDDGGHDDGGHDDGGHDDGGDG